MRIVLAGNPNVGKSTVFNSLTGLKQHTGNWTGKTVESAEGKALFEGREIIISDTPGTYSLSSASADEREAERTICFSKNDGIIVVCDATCLERNLNLLLQISEAAENVTVVVNMLDEAAKKGIEINLQALSSLLGFPVIGIVARKEKAKKILAPALEKREEKRIKILYQSPLKEHIYLFAKEIKEIVSPLSPEYIARRLLEGDGFFKESLFAFLNISSAKKYYIETCLEKRLQALGKTPEQIKEEGAKARFSLAEKIAAECVTFKKPDYIKSQVKIDKILCSRAFGTPIMLLLLGLILYLTVVGANYPSAFLSTLLFSAEEPLLAFFTNFLPSFFCELLVFGVYRVLSWVVSVMLPPMAIFFPLFSLLEDLGYLPRVAFNLDGIFQKCGSCGKQALTMSMGFGCNAVGVSGCRIISSPRERLIAILTNCFVPCNGRFPTLIAIITMFIIAENGFLAALFLLAFILLGIFTTFGVSFLLSKTVLKGYPSLFALEMPPFRKPQIAKTLLRSLLDRTLFVLGRAVLISAPCGMIIFLCANLNFGNQSLLMLITDFLNPIATFFGFDGVILTAFILGLPANEIVLPIIVMAYLSNGTVTEMTDLSSLKEILLQNGWSIYTALSVAVFSLFHWPCGTTLLIIKKETQSLKITAFAFLLPTAVGLFFCLLIKIIAEVF